MKGSTITALIAESGLSADQLRGLVSDLEATGTFAPLAKASYPSGASGRNGDEPALPVHHQPRGQVTGRPARASGGGAEELTRTYSQLSEQLGHVVDAESLGRLLRSVTGALIETNKIAVATARATLELADGAGRGDLAKSLRRDLARVLKAEGEDEDGENEDEQEDEEEGEETTDKEKAKTKSGRLEVAPVLRGDAMAVGTVASFFDTVLAGGNIAPPVMKAGIIDRIRDGIAADDTLSTVDQLSAANALMVIEARQAGQLDAFTAKCRLGAVPSRVRQAIERAAA